MLIAVRGLMVLVTFDDYGKILEIHRFGAGPRMVNSNILLGAEIPPGTWHTVVSLEPESVLLEVKAGPFDPDAPKILAPWAPEEGTSEGEIYLDDLVKVIAANA